MNLKEIEEQFNASVNQTVLSYINRIDRDMIHAYNQIKETGKIVFYENSLNQGYSFPSNMTKNIIEGLKKHYEKDWHISYTTKRKGSELIFTFTLKDYSESPEEIVVEKLEEIVKKPEKLKRVEILDL